MVAQPNRRLRCLYNEAISEIGGNAIRWKPSTTPCAVISKGTTNEQKVIVGTLEDIADKAKEIPTPAIIVVGEVENKNERVKVV